MSKNPLIDIIKASSERKPSISPKLIDVHSKICKDCEDRRLIMKNMYEIDMKTTNEMVARDLLFDEIYEDCCKCFLIFNGLTPRTNLQDRKIHQQSEITPLEIEVGIQIETPLETPLEILTEILPEIEVETLSEILPEIEVDTPSEILSPTELVGINFQPA